MTDKKLVSIICPLHNEEETIPLFFERVTKVIENLPYDFELIFMNNRSADNSLKIIQEIMKKEPSVKMLTLSRNFGYQASVQAGLSHARGDCIITIDVDCEDPPEMIPKFLEKWEEGYDIVYGIRTKRPEPRLLVALRNFFYKILKFTADTEIILNMAEFGLISNFVRDCIVNDKNTFPFLRSEIAYAGFKRIGIKYDRLERLAGKTHYNFWRMAIFGIGGILSSSTFPFRLAVYLLPLLIITNIAMLIAAITTDGPWFQILMVFDFLYFNMLLAFHGIYLARIYKNGLGRPLSIIDWKLSSPELRTKNA